MEKLIQAGRKFYGVCIVGFGIQQLVYAGFLPVILPAWPSWIPGVALFAYIAGVALIVIGAALVLEKNGRTCSLVLGGVFLLLFLLGHVPHLIFVNPYSQYLGSWTQAFKTLALTGGAFVFAGSYSEGKNTPVLIKPLEKLIPFGRIFFSITMIVFGIDHFLYVKVVAGLVPAWIPGHIFWTYFAGVALIGSGVAVILQIKLKLISMLLGIMIFLWFILLHIPRAIADPTGNMGNEVTSAFQALGFSGIAFLISQVSFARSK
jgi:uncharacterized membrane protein